MEMLLHRLEQPKTQVKSSTVIYGLKMICKTVSNSMCDSLVSSKFKYRNTVFGPYTGFNYKIIIQVVQNAGLRLSFGIRRHHKITQKLQDRIKWLNMENRRVLAGACVAHKIITCKSPRYIFTKLYYIKIYITVVKGMSTVVFKRLFT